MVELTTFGLSCFVGYVAMCTDMLLQILVYVSISVVSCAKITNAAGRVSMESDYQRNHLLNFKGEPLTWISNPHRPPIPAWPQMFTIKFYVYVEQYGNDWNSTGVLYYDWTSKVRD